MSGDKADAGENDEVDFGDHHIITIGTTAITIAARRERPREKVLSKRITSLVNRAIAIPKINSRAPIRIPSP